MLDELGAHLLDRLEDTTRTFATALDFGGRGAIAPALLARGMAVVSADISAPMAALAGGTPKIVTSEDFELGVEQFDLIVAHLALHWINDLPGALIQFRRALKPGGLMLASMPVLGTLAELRGALLEAEEQGYRRRQPARLALSGFAGLRGAVAARRVFTPRRGCRGDRIFIRQSVGASA